MKEGDFLLHKWTTNDLDLQSKIDQSEVYLGELTEKYCKLKDLC